MTYGNHMALHMAIGFLFLGGGRAALSRSDAAIAALVAALYPRLPAHTSDNQYSLQVRREGGREGGREGSHISAS